MVEIVCKSPKQVVILECTEYPSIETLSKTIAILIRLGHPIVLKWAEGVGFSYDSLQPTSDSLIREYLEGRIYWSDVIFALMPDYKPSVRVGTLDIPVIDVSPNPILREAAKWMKSSTQK